VLLNFSDIPWSMNGFSVSFKNRIRQAD